MARTTEADVRDIFDTSLDSAELGAFIEDASSLLDQQLGDSGLDPALLERIEKYVAAHMAAASDPRHTSTSGASRSASYEDRGGSGTGLMATAHGRRAVALDPTGSLASTADDFIFNT